MQETLENRKGLGHHVSLAGAGAEDSGKDVKDAGVEVGFDDGGKYLRRIYQGF